MADFPKSPLDAFGPGAQALGSAMSDMWKSFAGGGLTDIWKSMAGGGAGGGMTDMWKSLSGAGLPDIFKSIPGVDFSGDALNKLKSDYTSQLGALWNNALSQWGELGAPEVSSDRRFASEAWQKNPVAAAAAQLYLLNARTMMQMADAAQGDAKTKARIRFAVQQWIDASSPSNFLATNADALAKAVETKGESLQSGMKLLMQDIVKGHISQTDEKAFEVGRNVATTEGAVVFENELFQLIEYKPLTEQVHERPLLFVPPCINKYYIMDLQPENSVCRYAVENGHRLFIVSWRNPDQSMAGLTWDDYIEKAPITAIRAVQEICSVPTLNMLGFCVGGTILTTALSVLAARGQHPANSLTLFTTLLDFSNVGVLEVFIDEPTLALREYTIGQKSPTGPGLLKGKELATAFNFLRPNDLVWNYVANNYLKGEAPPPFDLLYWNGDSTNLPGPMFCWYLRHTYLQNDLKKPNVLTVCGEKVDFGSVKAPVFIYASYEDHIVPWQGAYASTALFPGEKTFVLGASGHIAGVINPAKKNKRSHWVNGKIAAKAEDWFDAATEKKGSWWPVWAEWLGQQGGKMVAAPKGYGSAAHPAKEPAPGSYVKQKA